MPTLPITELKRLTAPFATPEDEAEARFYWSEHPQERVEANNILAREFYRQRGLDIDAPMDKTVFRRITLEEKNSDHYEWHAAFDRFILDR